ncbi:MAG: hypothetical protein JNK85_19895 [Verrucomicrobiales bacterium]|nr:hypothetical protein [Verrucomicrobiales bacterium]
MNPPIEATPESPTSRIRRMESSLACFVSGWFALLPVLGLPMAVHGLLQFRASRVGTAGEWNPAARYRRWGALLSIVGLALHFVAIAAVALMLASRMTG